MPSFRAIVALYPFCPPKIAPPLASDIQILAGEADDWALASNCKAFVEKYGEDAPHRPILVVYPGARHSFDAKQPDRVYFGHRLAYDPTAAAGTYVGDEWRYDASATVYGGTFSSIRSAGFGIPSE